MGVTNAVGVHRTTLFSGSAGASWGRLAELFGGGVMVQDVACCDNQEEDNLREREKRDDWKSKHRSRTVVVVLLRKRYAHNL